MLLENVGWSKATSNKHTKSKQQTVLYSKLKTNKQAVCFFFLLPKLAIVLRPYLLVFRLSLVSLDEVPISLRTNSSHSAPWTITIRNTIQLNARVSFLRHVTCYTRAWCGVHAFFRTSIPWRTSCLVGLSKGLSVKVLPKKYMSGRQCEVYTTRFVVLSIFLDTTQLNAWGFAYLAWSHSF